MLERVFSEGKKISAAKFNAEKKLRWKCHTAKIPATKFQMAKLDSGPEYSPQFTKKIPTNSLQRMIPSRGNSPPENSPRKFPP